MWVGIDCNDKELRVCAATVYLKAGQRDDDTEGCDSATPAVAKSKSPPVNQRARSPHDAKLQMQNSRTPPIWLPYMSDVLTVICVTGFVEQARDFRLTQISNGLPFFIFS